VSLDNEPSDVRGRFLGLKGTRAHRLHWARRNHRFFVIHSWLLVALIPICIALMMLPAVAPGMSAHDIAAIAGPASLVGLICIGLALLNLALSDSNRFIAAVRLLTLCVIYSVIAAIVVGGTVYLLSRL
jgi:hypothetical protein